MQTDSEPTTLRSRAATEQLLREMRQASGLEDPQPSPFMRRVRRAADYAETTLAVSAIALVLFCFACGLLLPPVAMLALLRFLGVL